MNTEQRLGVMTERPNKRASSVIDRTQIRNSSTFRQSPTRKLLFGRESHMYESKYGTSTKNRTRRNRIFDKLPKKMQHFQIGTHLSNLHFDELDTSILPRLFYAGSCECQNSLEPCKRVVKSLAPGAVTQMDRRYQRMKDKSKYDIAYIQIKDLISRVPKNYPLALISIVQNLLQFIRCDETIFPVLYSIVWHCKCESLSYFAFMEKLQTTYDVQNFISEVNGLINIYSKDLKVLIQKLPEISQFYKRYCATAGTNVIPVVQYGKYLECCNAEGRSFPSRALFVAMLDAKTILDKNSHNIQSFVECFQGLSQKLPWGRIFQAAKSRYLKQ